MILLIILLIIVTLYGVRISSFHNDYMGLDATNAIKGLFAVLILFSHMRQYLVLGDTYADNSYLGILNYIGQMMVTMYLFYSGYGLLESFKRKPNYKKRFLKNRVLKILIHFDVAVLLYIVLQLVLGKNFSAFHYLGSLIGWSSVGNSNWFIFDILVLYFIFYIALCCGKHFIQKEDNICVGGAILLTVFLLCVLMWIFLNVTKGQSRWINNIFVFPLGICYSLYKAKVEEWIRKGFNYYYVFVTLTLALVAWRSFHGIDRMGLCTCLFAIWVVLLSMKIKLDNKALQWLGTLAFAIFILQRLPMIVLTHFGVNQYPYVFALIVIPSTFVIAYLYTIFLKSMDGRLFRKNL